jgi:hypothetical protein
LCNSHIGPEENGYLFIGVADKEADALRIQALDGIDYKTINQRYIVGIDRELNHLGGTLDNYINKMMGKISKSELSEPLKSQVLSQLDVIDYKNLTVIRLRVPKQNELSFVGKKSFIRENSQTLELDGPKLIAISKLFN